MSARWLPLGVVSALLSACKEPDDTPQLLEALERAAIATPALAASAAHRPHVNPRLLRRFEPLRAQLDSAANPITPAKVELGHMLFFDRRLSRQHDVSCSSCHDLKRYGADQQRTSPGSRGGRGTRNTPTVYNAAGHFAQFWDGHANDVETQAAGPLLNPTEMALPSPEHGVRVLKSMPAYVTAFKEAFPEDADPVTFVNIGRALGAFERRLTTPARWDDYLRGKSEALSNREMEGLAVFANAGCMSCHMGELVGGSMYQKAGAVQAWPNQKDQGRYETTKQEADRMMFKVPSLRNVVETAPYFHDGSVPTLDLAVRMMGQHQLGMTLSDDDVSAIVAWLGSLTGKLPEQYLEAPKLPANTASTPRPLP